LGPFQFDRIIGNGDVITWENIPLCCDWMPGQTKFHACLHGEIDGRRVAFTGDNIFASTTLPNQAGNEAVVARNGGTLEEGYIYAGNFLHSIAPDLIVGGHCWVLDQPRDLIRRYRQRMLALREAFQALSEDDDYRYMFDAYWISAAPYRLTVNPGKTVLGQIVVRNYRSRPQKHRIEFHALPGLTIEPPVIEGVVGADETEIIPIKVTAHRAAAEGLRIAAMDITRDLRRHGQLFDFLVHVGQVPDQKPNAPAPSEKSGKY
jgi:glyoxylase-like metal-dependent hydrolase (beta-lactamase superfamily II)